MNNNLFDKEIARPILDALDTGRQELAIVAGAHDFVTARTDEGPAVCFFLPSRYMQNGASSVIVCQHEDDTYSVIFFKGEKEVDRISHCDKRRLRDEWWEHTACAIQIPIVAHADKFLPGMIVGTPEAHATFTGFEIRQALNLHLAGNWGEVCREDKKLNNESLKDGGRLLSAYTFRGKKLWIITNAVGEDGKRDATTVLLPWEY